MLKGVEDVTQCQLSICLSWQFSFDRALRKNESIGDDSFYIQHAGLVDLEQYANWYVAVKYACWHYVVYLPSRATSVDVHHYGNDDVETVMYVNVCTILFMLVP